MGRRRLQGALVLAASAAFLSLLVVGNGGALEAAARVGVVLDLTSDEGRKSLSGISMALDDFYLEHPSFTTTRVELRVRDSRGELAAAAHAAEELIKNDEVHAIVMAPRTPKEADLVARLRHHHHVVVPILTFSGSHLASRQPPHVAPFSTHATSAKDDDEPYHATQEDNIAAILAAIISRRRQAAAIGPWPDSAPRSSRLDDDRPAETDRRSNSRRLLVSRNKSGKVLRIAVPLKTGFQAFVDVKNPDTKRQDITGYCIDLFQAAMSKIKLELGRDYEFHAFNGSYDALVLSVYSGQFSAAVGDVTITSERSNLVEFTMPYTPSGVSMLVLKENDSKPIQWIFVRPLTWKLWLATFGFFFFTGFVVWMIEHPRNPEYQGSSLRQLSTASYFAFSTLTFSHGQIIRSPLSRIVVVTWCFVVLILVQSYTASLSSILTAKRLRPSVTNLDQLRRNGDYVGYQGGSFVYSYLISRGFTESRLKPYETPEEYADALRNGSKNGVKAIVDEYPYLTPFLSNPRYQKEFQLVNRFYKTPGFGFVFPLGSPLVHDLSTAILNITGDTEDSKIKEKWFGSAEQFTDSDVDPSSTDSNSLTVQSFSGLFVISGSISILMLLISIVKRLVDATRAKEARDNVQGGDDSNISEESLPLQNVMDNNSAHDQAIQVRNDGDEGPRPMHNGSVPEHLVQMERNIG